VVDAPVIERRDAQPDQPLAPLLHHSVSGKNLQVLQHHVIAMRDQLSPALRPRISDRRVDETEVPASAAVGPDVKERSAVIDLVLVVMLSRQEHDPRRGRRARQQVAALGGREARRDGEEIR
jgi:hypothetical protein